VAETMMAETTTETMWQKIARNEFPWYAITGDGPLAVVLGCRRQIVLVQNPMMARTIKADSCGPGCDHISEPYGGWHTIRELKPPEPRRAFRRIRIRDEE
jgi:hypothetical protein